MSVTTASSNNEVVNQHERASMLAAEACITFALKSAKRLVQLSADEIDSLKRLAVAFTQAPDSERPEIIEAIVELVLPDDAIGSLEKRRPIDNGARERVNASRRFVGEQIRRYREAAGMTQTALARKAKIPQSHVSRLERGKHAPSHLTIARIAKALKVEPDAIDPGFNMSRKGGD